LNSENSRHSTYYGHGISADDANRYDAIAAIPESDLTRLLDEEATNRPINTWGIIDRWQEIKKIEEPPISHRNSPARTAEQAAERDRKIIDLINQNHGTHAIAHMLQVSPFRVTEIKRHLGITEQNRLALKERERQVLELSQQGKSLSEIAKVIGLKPKSISAVKRRLGLIEKAKAETKERDNRIAELARQGTPTNEIAREVHLSRSTVTAAKQRLGITEEIRNQVVEQDNKIAELTREGRPAGEIATKLKIRPQQVYYTKTRLGIGNSSKHDPFAALIEMIFQCAGAIERALDKGEDSVMPSTPEKAKEMKKELVRLRRNALQFMKRMPEVVISQDTDAEETE
jgi:DNA-binding CsgD family transcriptional regulator